VERKTGTLEDLAMNNSYNNNYQGKTVLVTGHTGFKGSWLSLWLLEMGAKVIGYAQEPESTPNHFNLLELDMVSIIGDIRDEKKLSEVFREYQPEIVFHLAAQPFVRRSYKEPVETFDTNVMGTVKLLEACRHTPSVKAIVVITSDKCYENKEWAWGYRENDPLGGHDPYSASKGATEIVAASYRSSFFNPSEYGKSHHTLLATCRAGNVIGGGDWGEDRLIPDIVRAVESGTPVEIRSPDAIRPWQHVLDALSGYLLVGEKLLEGDASVADAWNFGPKESDTHTVAWICNRMAEKWEEVNMRMQQHKETLHEATLLKLDCSKAHLLLRWQGKWDAEKAIDLTTQWYKEFINQGKIITKEQLSLWISQ